MGAASRSAEIRFDWEDRATWAPALTGATAAYITYAPDLAFPGAADKVGTELYAMGWTQHTTGTQNIRAMAIIQLLLGNVGCAGGGINALRGESNVQGSTDHALLFHVLPARRIRCTHPVAAYEYFARSRVLLWVAEHLLRPVAKELAGVRMQTLG